MSIFTGAAVALITPMHEDGSINYEEMERIVNDQINHGTDAIVICGTTGEASTMTHEEHIETIKACVEMTKKRVPVIAGSGSNCTDTAIFLSREAQKAGADGLLVVSPYYNKATQKGLKQHFTAVAGSVDIPIILYNIQGRTGVNIQPKTIAELAKEVDNIVAVKEASGDLSQIATLMAMTQGDLDVYSGNDDQIVPITALGGKGVISVFSNFCPKEMHEICQACLDNDFQRAAEMNFHFVELMDIMFSDVNPIPVKTAMNLIGFNAGECRLPLVPMSYSGYHDLKDCLAKYNLLDKYKK